MLDTSSVDIIARRPQCPWLPLTVLGFDPHAVELMLKHGFKYESSMMGNDYLPYSVPLSYPP